MTAKEHIEAAKKDGVDLLEVLDPKTQKEIEEDVEFAITIIVTEGGQIKAIPSSMAVKVKRQAHPQEIKNACRDIFESIDKAEIAERVASILMSYQKQAQTAAFKAGKNLVVPGR